MLFFVFLIGGAVLAGLGYQALGKRLDRRRFPPPGRLVRIGSSRWHVHEQGSGRPVVILEAGIAGTSLGWSLVQPKIAALSTVVSYDRAGLGWSDACRAPRTIEQMTDELSDCLRAAELGPPYLLVGHSFGGLLVRAYAARHPEEVAGLVLVDPVSASLWARCGDEERRRLAVGVRLSRRGAVLARVGIVRASLWLLVSGGRFLPKLIGRAAAGRGSSAMERLIGEVQKLPRETWPMIQAHWSDPKCFRAMAAYLECLPNSAEEALAITTPPHVPITILSARDATAEEIAERDQWARSSLHGKHIRVNDAGHWIQLERPDAVVEAVREQLTCAGDSLQGHGQP